VLLPALLAVVQLRQLGALALLALMAIVWVADITAYFAGRAFGKRKLAPSISPGKTWAGAYGAVAGVVGYGLAASAIVDLPGPAVLIPVLVVLTVLSIVGDLFESLLKRQADIKDSSNVLPGHGGVLDRIDSLTSTLPLIALGWLLGGA
jgi:phosphatidate cytidylyltransferase